MPNRKPVCETCRDTHRVERHRSNGDVQEVMCTSCPTPCEACRSRGPGRAGGPFCAVTPCPCACHADSFQYRGRGGTTLPPIPDVDSGELDLNIVGGNVARPFTEEEVRARLTPLAALIDAGRAPSIVLCPPVIEALRAGRHPRRGLVVLRVLGPLLNALVVLLALDARREASRRKLHDAVRALDAPSLDALDDMLARFPAVSPIVEAERMHRAGLLCADWSIVLDARQPGPDGRIAARVLAPLRAPVASA